MEEKKTKEKLTYEQLEAYAQQTTVQAQQIFKENQALKQALQQERLNTNFKEIELALRCLDHADLFSPDFIKVIVTRLEEVLTPVKSEDKEETEKEG